MAALARRLGALPVRRGRRGPRTSQRARRLLSGLGVRTAGDPRLRAGPGQGQPRADSPRARPSALCSPLDKHLAFRGLFVEILEDRVTQGEACRRPETPERCLSSPMSPGGAGPSCNRESGRLTLHLGRSSLSSDASLPARPGPPLSSLLPRGVRRRAQGWDAVPAKKDNAHHRPPKKWDSPRGRKLRARNLGENREENTR